MSMNTHRLAPTERCSKLKPSAKARRAASKVTLSVMAETTEKGFAIVFNLRGSERGESLGFSKQLWMVTA
jgi:hypothetical protein